MINESHTSPFDIIERNFAMYIKKFETYKKNFEINKIINEPTTTNMVIYL